MSNLLRAVALLSLLGLGACATIVEGGDQNVSVMTEPAGAKCNIERKGEIVAVVNPSPGTARVSKSKDDAIIVCSKDQHETATADLRSRFGGMTLGNVIFGGLIGVGVDAASGAMNKYPESVMLFVPPREFASIEARDAYFERMRTYVQDGAVKAIDEANRSCNYDTTACKPSIEAIEKRREAELADIEARKAAAKLPQPVG